MLPSWKKCNSVYEYIFVLVNIAVYEWSKIPCCSFCPCNITWICCTVQLGDSQREDSVDIHLNMRHDKNNLLLQLKWAAKWAESSSCAFCGCACMCVCMYIFMRMVLFLVCLPWGTPLCPALPLGGVDHRKHPSPPHPISGGRHRTPTRRTVTERDSRVKAK